MEDEGQNYHLIGGEDSKNNNDDQNDKETAYLINDGSNQIQNVQNISPSSSNIINTLTNSFDINNFFSKFIIIVLLLNPIISLMIENNKIVKKVLNKSKRTLIKRILIIFMLFCLFGISSTNIHETYFLEFFCKFLLVFFLLIHTNILNVFKLEETAQFWKKIFQSLYRM